MAKFNHYLTTNSQDLKEFHEDLDIANISWNQAVQPKFYKVTQKNALKLVLLNVAKYGTREILYSRRNEETEPKQHRPHLVSNKSILNVVDALSANGLLEKTTGDKWFMTIPDERQTSTFIAKDSLVTIARSCFPETTITELEKTFISFKDSITGKHIPYEPTNYTLRIQQVMKSINEFTNEQDITLFGESLLPIFYQRKYIDYYNTRETYPFVFNGRCYPSHVYINKDKRAEIKINGEGVTSLDYSSSVPSHVYSLMTGVNLKDINLVKPYEVHDKIPRAVAKRAFNIMLNTSMEKSGFYGVKATVASHFTAPKCDQEEKNAWAKTKETFGDDDIKTANAVIKYVVEKNKSVSQAFLQGKQYGQHWAWLEANLVYEVALFMMKELEVPLTIIHDEFLVPESRAEGLEDYMHTIALDEDYYKTNFTNSIFTQKPVDFEDYLDEVDAE
jgi:hypothetical protein